MKLAVPIDLRDGDGEPVISQGPFALEHNGHRSVGTMLRKYSPQGGYVVEDDYRAYELSDEDYSVRTEGNTIIFHSDIFESTFKIRALELDDAVWILPEDVERPPTVDDLKETVAELMGTSVRTYSSLPNDETLLAAAENTPQDDTSPPHTFVTLDDAGKVLELARSDKNGIYIRSNGQWFMIDPNAEEEDIPTVWNREWVDVEDSAVETFDAADRAEQGLTRADFEQFIIAQ